MHCSLGITCVKFDRRVYVPYVRKLRAREKLTKSAYTEIGSGASSNLRRRQRSRANSTIRGIPCVATLNLAPARVAYKQTKWRPRKGRQFERAGNRPLCEIFLL